MPDSRTQSTRESSTVVKEKMEREGWGLVRDVVRLFFDHHTLMIAETLANRAKDPDYQKESTGVSDHKVMTLGSPTGSKKMTRRQRERLEKNLDAGGGGGGGADATSHYGPATAVDDDLQVATTGPQKQQPVRPQPKQQDACASCGGYKCTLGMIKAQGIAGACMWGAK